MASRFDYYHHELRANRRRWRRFAWTCTSVMLMMMLLYTLAFGPAEDIDQRPVYQHDIASSIDASRSYYQFHQRTLLQVANGSATSTTTTSTTSTARTTTAAKLTTAAPEAPKQDPKFPPDLFTEQQRRNGAVICHIFGMIYMFVALAIVCDEFFIPALDVITEKMEISEDVAGATFMAAGGSAPELFTSIIGVFISYDDVGIGTIVGSAVFNILFVLSMCAIFSKSVLELTWWPLFRDVSFYSFILITLVLCFKDSTIFWYEALILLLWYAGYVLFMKYNETLERTAKNMLAGGRVDNNKELVKQDSLSRTYQGGRKMSTPILHGGSKFRQGVLQLMIHSIDPLYEEPINMAAAATTKKGDNDEILKDHVHPPGAAHCPICGEEKHGLKLNTNGVYHASKTLMADKNFANGEEGTGLPNEAVIGTHAGNLPPQESVTKELEPLDVSWPKTLKKQVNYIMLMPIIIPLWLTMPDVRKPEKRKWYAFSFIGSIIWIAIYSYLMVWWATLAGETFRIPAEIMGLTFLAAGTSIPDLITSVLVARKGFGDMAVSSSVGSNIFDVTVGLPFPWFLYTVLFGPVAVNSSGMICSVILLFLMLLFVILTIAVFNWRLNVGMAIVMFILYFFFIACTLLLEYHVVDCVSITGFLHI